jgi:hypothetical protein
MNSKFLAGLNYSELLLFCFFARQQMPCVSFPPDERISLPRSSFSQDSTSLIHSAKLCCYRKSVCVGVLRVAIFSLCIPVWRTVPCIRHSYEILRSLSLATTETHFVSTVAGYINTEGTKHQLSVYDKKRICYIVSNAYLHFNRVFVLFW